MILYIFVVCTSISSNWIGPPDIVFFKSIIHDQINKRQRFEHFLSLYGLFVCLWFTCAFCSRPLLDVLPRSLRCIRVRYMPSPLPLPSLSYIDNSVLPPNIITLDLYLSPASIIIMLFHWICCWNLFQRDCNGILNLKYLNSLRTDLWPSFTANRC